MTNKLDSLSTSLQAELSSGRTSETRGPDRRTLLAAAGGAVLGGLGRQVVGSSEAVAAPSSVTGRIDAHTHFAPPKFLEYAEKEEGKPFVLSGLYRSKPTLTDLQQRLALLDRNEVDVHVLVPLPWLEGFPKISSNRMLAAEAARIMNDELAAIVAAQPKRFRGVAMLPGVDPDAMIAELIRAVKQLGFVGAYVPVVGATHCPSMNAS